MEKREREGGREKEQLITRLAAPLNWKLAVNSVLIISVDTSCFINVGLYFMDSIFSFSYDAANNRNHR